MISLGSARLGKSRFAVGSLCPGCDDALFHSSSFHGVPLPGVGLAYFATLGFLLAIGSPWFTRLALLLSSAGVGVSATLSAALLQSGERCWLCLLIHIANLGLAILLWRQVGRQPRREEDPVAPFSSKVWAFAGVLAMTTTALIGIALYRPAVDTGNALAEYEAQPLFDLASDSEDAVLGPPTAPVRLVVFSSFQCHWCQAFAPSVHHLSERFGKDVTIVFKNFPLGKECNPSLQIDMQPRACAAAWAAEAAHRQKAFWPFHDRLFLASLNDSEEALTAMARAANLDLDRWNRDRRSLEVRAKVARDVLLGQRFGVAGTPTVFLNGRPVKNPTLPVLEALIRQERERLTKHS